MSRALIVLTILALVTASAPQGLHAAETETVTGWLAVVWGSAEPGSDVATATRADLHTDDGRTIRIHTSADLWRLLGPVNRSSGTRVTVTLEPGDEPRRIRAVAVARSQSRMPEDISGSHPWISILCKFAGNASEPKPVSFYRDLYGTSWPGLNHYWRTLSYEQANVDGSTAVAWVQLPHPVSHYADAGPDGSWSSSDVDLNALFDDCTAAADHLVYYPDFVGINMMFNDDFGPWAWGGSRGGSMDGGGWWRVTWEPPWGWGNQCVLAHEMGHGFGLPHSNNADDDGYPYDNPWDVMSSAWNYAQSSSTYGTIGKGTISYHLDILGWIPADEQLQVGPGELATATVDHLALPTTSNLRMITVPIAGTNRFYTVEVRDREEYDSQLPGFAVIIHEVDPYRLEDAWLVDATDPDNGADAGAMWIPGECFEDGPNEISICVQSVATEGYVVRVLNDAGEIFSDGFESGTLNDWS